MLITGILLLRIVMGITGIMCKIISLILGIVGIIAGIIIGHNDLMVIFCQLCILCLLWYKMAGDVAYLPWARAPLSSPEPDRCAARRLLAFGSGRCDKSLKTARCWCLGHCRWFFASLAFPFDVATQPSQYWTCVPTATACWPSQPRIGVSCFGWVASADALQACGRVTPNVESPDCNSYSIRFNIGEIASALMCLWNCSMVSRLLHTCCPICVAPAAPVKSKVFSAYTCWLMNSKVPIVASAKLSMRLLACRFPAHRAQVASSPRSHCRRSAVEAHSGRAVRQGEHKVARGSRGLNEGHGVQHGQHNRGQGKQGFHARWIQWELLTTWLLINAKKNAWRRSLSPFCCVNFILRMRRLGWQAMLPASVPRSGENNAIQINQL